MRSFEEMKTTSRGPAQFDKLYLYCVLDKGEGKNFGPIGLAAPDRNVFTVSHDGMSVAVSSVRGVSGESAKAVSKKNLLAHDGVLQEIMKQGHTVLPIKFGTIVGEEGNPQERDALEERVRAGVLRARRNELRRLLTEVEGTQEMGIKALWKDMDPVYEEIREHHPELTRLRRLVRQRRRVSRDTAIRAGEMARDALRKRRKQEQERILASLTPMARQVKRNPIFGDAMVTNAAFLVHPEEIGSGFDEAVVALRKEEEERGNLAIRYVGPLPICNFVNLRIALGT